jgi:toxin ParE1/3/4
MTPVVFTASAYADLLAIARAIARDNPGRALSFVAELEDRCLSLGHMPEAYPLVPGWEEQGIRRRPYRSYLIFYRLRADQAEIIHVLHGARDYEDILGGTEP